jgi:hypothetical protein
MSRIDVKRPKPTAFVDVAVGRMAAPTGAAQGTTGERAKAAILWRREGLSAVYDRLPTKFFSALCLVATIGHRFD